MSLCINCLPPPRSTQVNTKTWGRTVTYCFNWLSPLLSSPSPPSRPLSPSSPSFSAPPPPPLPGTQETDGEELEGVRHKNVINLTLTLRLLPHIQFFILKPYCCMKTKKKENRRLRQMLLPEENHVAHLQFSLVFCWVTEVAVTAEVNRIMVHSPMAFLNYIAVK